MMNDYQRIAKAIDYLCQHAGQQPTLDQVAAHVHLSAFHFQRLFCQWAGISPKRFLQIMTLEKAKTLIAANRPLLQTSAQVGLSSASRLYDHFVSLDAMTPGEYKSGGRNLQISCAVHSTPFGDLLVAQTSRGICKADFVDTSDLTTPVRLVQNDWPNADIVENPATGMEVATLIGALLRGEQTAADIRLHVRGTNLQVAVWRALLNTGSGDSLSYSDLAVQVFQPQSVRAVANAVGANPVALLIPCHRVIRKSGALGGYRWGEQRKQAVRIFEQIAQSV